MKHTNPQVEQMTSFIVMDVLEKANELQKQGVDIIHLEVGEPDFDVGENSFAPLNTYSRESPREILLILEFLIHLYTFEKYDMVDMDY